MDQPPPSGKAPLIKWLSRDLKRRFGGKVVKVSLDAGLSCPNRGPSSRETPGCAWCDPGGSGPDRDRDRPWIEVLRDGASRAAERGAPGVIAYFQAYTNTHGPVSRIRDLFEQALGTPGVLGLAVGTRPDCLPGPILDLLEELSERTYLWVEVGMQTRHDATLSACRRGHVHASTVEAAEALRARKIRTVLHLIVGLPGEDGDAVRESFREAARLDPRGVKIHPLHVVRGAPFEERWIRGDLPLLSFEDYASLAADGLEILPAHTTIHRITGERPEGILLAPDWCREKSRVIAAIEAELRRRGTRQGFRFAASV